MLQGTFFNIQKIEEVEGSYLAQLNLLSTYEGYKGHFPNMLQPIVEKMIHRNLHQTIGPVQKLIFLYSSILLQLLVQENLSNFLNAYLGAEKRFPQLNLRVLNCVQFFTDPRFLGAALRSRNPQTQIQPIHVGGLRFPLGVHF